MSTLRHSPVLLLALGTCASSPDPSPAPITTRVRVDTVRIVDTVARPPAVPHPALQAGQFDNGKSWILEYPPPDYFREAYGFAPDSVWFIRTRCTRSASQPHRLLGLGGTCCGDDPGTWVG